ncbi:MAG TPA: LacI family DNA-binding transcriptional regulator [Pseudonocardiaceae bacterium]|jgi:DNA-binding LacI/PurR family transcriptional regulator|nr:LacI family DNA-binding transcriptional regulator [Pseudonocardiaceae bacterium]
MSRPTIGDIAAKAGVSIGAVSFALNGRSGVSDATRARILLIAQEMGWRPHSAARALGGAKAGMVGLVSARPARTLGVEPFFAQLVSGLQAGLSTRGVGLQLLIVEDLAAEVDIYRKWHSEHHVDGVVLFDLRSHDPRVAELERSTLPCVVLGPGKHPSLPNVWADDRAAMLRVVEYLAALGHRRIAHVAGLPELWHTQRRIRALRDAAGRLELLDATSAATDFSDAEGAAVTRRLLARRPRPSAIVYDSDVMAVAGLGVALEMGLSVPGDLSIVAFDDSVLARLMHPALTALSRDTFALGELVATTLLEAIDAAGDAGGAAERSVRAPMPELVIRESTSPPAGNGIASSN